MIYDNIKNAALYEKAYPLLAEAFDFIREYNRAPKPVGRYELQGDALYAMDKNLAADVIRRYGADRVFFGTDYPMWKPEDEIARVNALPLTQEEREMIFHKNFEKFIGEA